ncbi:MAG TPA: cation:proton antiporter [Acidimicrobiales bacterium]|nr:cation:proton antiporter [Acidimicrobiales bacterium]
MDVVSSIDAFGATGAGFAVLGVAVLAVAALPRLLHGRALSFPVALVGLGMAAFALPLGLPDPDPVRHREVAEHLAELVVIVALTNVGLKLDRRFSWRGWSTTWRLLAIAMPLTVAAVALLGWWLVGLAPAAAVLLGAVVSPTDPVLAAEVQVGGPGQGSENAEATEVDETEPVEEDEVRFGLTSEAGLNDGLAFPYTNMAIAMAAGAAPAAWLGSWLAVDVAYKLAMGVAVGVVIGKLLAVVILALPSPTETGKALTGVAAVAVTLTAYGVAEWFGGYGFLAVFVAAYVLRHSDRDHEYHEKLVHFVEQLERVLTSVVLVLLGGAVVRGVLDGLTVSMVVVAVLVVFIVRPVAGALSMLGSRRSVGAERAALGFFGIRGVGSFYYLAHALGEARFADVEGIWALVVFVTLLSIVMHGLSASIALGRIDDHRAEDPVGARAARHV